MLGLIGAAQAQLLALLQSSTPESYTSRSPRSHGTSSDEEEDCSSPISSGKARCLCLSRERLESVLSDTFHRLDQTFDRNLSADTQELATDLLSTSVGVFDFDVVFVLVDKGACFAVSLAQNRC